MASARTRSGEAKMVAGRPTARVLEMRSDGYITRAELLRALDDAEGLLADFPDIDAMLWNTLGNNGNDPGNAQVGITFHRRHMARFQRAAILTHSAPMASLSNVARALLPGLSVGVFAKREDAVAWLTRNHAQHGGKRTRAA